MWKIVEKLENITENLEDINEYLDKVHETNIAFNNWIGAALVDIQKDIIYLRIKRLHYEPYRAMEEDKKGISGKRKDTRDTVQNRQDRRVDKNGRAPDKRDESL